jgi:hypothetical protein
MKRPLPRAIRSARHTGSAYDRRMNDNPKCVQMSARVIGGLAVAAALAGCASGAASSAGVQSRPAASASVQFLPVPKTPTIAQVAAEMHATGASGNCGGGTGVGAVATGTAYLGRERIGIDVFPSNALRDSWKSGVAASFGVTIIVQGTDWVAYKYLSQTGTGCN